VLDVFWHGFVVYENAIRKLGQNGEDVVVTNCSWLVER